MADAEGPYEDEIDPGLAQRGKRFEVRWALQDGFTALKCAA